jgi:hypothetical protein
MSFHLLSRRLSNSGDHDAVEAQNSPILGWLYDEEERVIPGSSQEGGIFSFTSPVVSETEPTMNFASIHQRQTSMEISVSLDHVEEYPSPSSVSLLHSSSEDLSEIEFSIPSLPLHRAENTSRIVSADSSPAIPSYTSRRRRREDNFDQSRNAQHSKAHLDLSFADRPLSAPASSSHNSSSSNTSPIEQRSRIWILRGIPRIVLTVCAVTFVALSIHDRVEVASHDFHQQLSSSGSRREEVAFPLGHSDAMMHGETKHDLPKFYLPKLESAGDGGKLSKASESARKDWSIGQTDNASSHLRQHRSTTFAMARSREARPIFIPDQPLPDGGFRKPIERFVFDPTEQQKLHREQQQQRGMYSRRSKTLSWTSWLASVAFVGILLDTGWKEYQRCRLLQEQERRL